MRSEKLGGVTSALFVSVSTQTDGDVEGIYFDLSVSSGSSVSLTMSNLDISSDESNGCLAKRRVMSSQTDLTLSDFDLGVSNDSDDFDDDLDEGLDNSFNPYEQILSVQSTDNPDYSDIMMQSPMSYDSCLTNDVTNMYSPRERNCLDAVGQCQQFFDLLRNRCNREGILRSGGIQTVIETSRPDEVQEAEKDSGTGNQRNADDSRTGHQRSADVTNRAFTKAPTYQNVSKFPSRMVPKMGTKVDFNRPAGVTSVSGHVPLSCHVSWQLPPMPPTRCFRPLADQNFPATPDARPEGNGFSSSQCRSKNFNKKRDLCRATTASPSTGGAYHSDSEQQQRTNFATPSSLGRNQKEWNSDGDAKNVSFPSSDDSVEQQTPDQTDASKTDAKPAECLQRLYEQYADVMYTNQANLQHTIMVQQKLFEQQIANRLRPDDKKPIMRNVASSRHGSNPEAFWAHGSGSVDRSGPLEWVIKRRPDGTRYITRRPIPGTMTSPAAAVPTKERPKHRIDERRLFTAAAAGDDRRCVGTTTDDDAMSEPKTGRYWTKEERRQHLLKARNQRRAAKEGVTQVSTAREEVSSEKHPTAHFKMGKAKKEHCRQKSQDQRATFQELLVHGKVESPGKTENPLLSVVTI